MMKIVVKGIWLWSSLEGDKKENKITLEKNTYRIRQIVRLLMKHYSWQATPEKKKKAVPLSVMCIFFNIYKLFLT